MTAATPLELIRIGGDALGAVLARRPDAAGRLEQVAHRRSQMARAVLKNDDLGGALSFLVTEGVLASPDLLVVDLGRCTRCGQCEAACAGTHGASLIALQGGTLGGRLFPTACRQCRDPQCLLRCPVDAIHRGLDGEVQIAEHCLGCGRCQANCPWGTITMLPRRPPRTGTSRRGDRQAMMCDLCAGIGGAPRCVLSCATAALALESPRDILKPILAKAAAV